MKFVKLELERQGCLGHLVPAFLHIWMKVLELVFGFTDDHAIYVLVSEVSVSHVELQALELAEISGHYF